jgi:hypothetical protein
MKIIRHDGHDYIVDVLNTSTAEVSDIFVGDDLVESVTLDHIMEQACGNDDSTATYNYFELIALTPDDRMNAIVRSWAAGEY